MVPEDTEGNDAKWWEDGDPANQNTDKQTKCTQTSKQIESRTFYHSSTLKGEIEMHEIIKDMK